MASGTLILIGIGAAAWLLARTIDSTKQARTSRGIQLCAFLVGMLEPRRRWCSIVELVARTTTNEIVAAAAFIALCLCRDSLIWRKRDERGTNDVAAR
jgi:hypothetical protein